MDIAAQILAAALGIALLAIAIAHLLWSVGILWPIGDEKLLARTVIGRNGIEKMPSMLFLLGVALLNFAACVIMFSVADPEAGGVPLTLLAVVFGLIFVARGLVGYSAHWRALTPEEPFRSYDRSTYSPLCLILGIGFFILVVMRLL